MAELPRKPDEVPDERDVDAAERALAVPPDADTTSMPRWVPILIGVVLVVIAGLAVFTGLRYRDEGTLTARIRPRKAPAMTPAPPGEPGAGASLVLHGEGGENVPPANSPVEGRSSAVISGGPGGVESILRMWAQRGMVLDVKPPDAMVYVNDLPVGQVRQFDSPNEVYDFAEAGSYTVRLVSPDGVERLFIVTADEKAQQEVATIRADLTTRR